MADKIHLVVVEPNNGGGLVHFAYQLCNAFANDERMDVTLVTGIHYEMSGFPHNFHVEKMLRLWEHFDPDQMKVELQNPLERLWRKLYWTLRRGMRGIRLVLIWISLTNYLLRVKPDIVQFSRYEYPFESFFIGFLHRQGILVSQICHEFEQRESTDLVSFVLDKISGEIYRHFSAIFFLSEEVRKKFLALHSSVPEENIYVIPHGNSGWLLNIPAVSEEVLRKRHGLREDERVVLFFGLLSPSKGLDDLLDAFAIVRASSNIRLVIAGYPTKHINMNDLLEKAINLGIEEHVIFDPRYIPLEEIRPLMGIASIVVFPYRSGTQSGALQTTYTFGRPIIATSVGGLPEVVDDGKNGFVVPPLSPQALAEKIILLVNDPAKAEEMGNYARRLSETRFAWQPIAQTIIKVYEQLIEERSG